MRCALRSSSSTCVDGFESATMVVTLIAEVVCG